jgi:hypothetical protein
MLATRACRSNGVTKGQTYFAQQQELPPVTGFKKRFNLAGDPSLADRSAPIAAQAGCDRLDRRRNPAAPDIKNLLKNMVRFRTIKAQVKRHTDPANSSLVAPALEQLFHA